MHTFYLLLIVYTFFMTSIDYEQYKPLYAGETAAIVMKIPQICRLCFPAP